MGAASGTAAGVKPAPRDEAREAEIEARPDTFVLTRIIGNDLVPRHAEGQSLANLRFILDHEPPLADCEKRFVVNRILDDETRAAVVAELVARGQAFTEVPFDWDDFARAAYDFAPFPPGFFQAPEFMGDLDEERQRALVRSYAPKNRYVMNNNGARNAALIDGRGRAKWVLPWDGNCFVTAEAWDEIRAAVRAAPGARYLIVPMARITDNARLLEAGFRPEAVEEPQVIFRADAAEVFDERQVYGRRPKVELFCRLGVEGPWDTWRLDPWDVPPRPVSPEAHRVASGGWVARLFSGQARAETADTGGFMERGSLRRTAIMRTIDRADMLLLSRRGFDPDALAFYDPARLAEAAATPAWVAAVRRGAAGTGSTEMEESGPPTATMRATVRAALAHAATGEGGFRDRALGAVRVWLRDHAAAVGGAAIAPRGFHEFLDAVRLLGPSEEAKVLRARLQAGLDGLEDGPEGRRARAARSEDGVYFDLQEAAAAAFLGDTGRLVAVRHRASSRIADHFAPQGRLVRNARETADATARRLQTWLDLGTILARVCFVPWPHNETQLLRAAVERFLARAETAGEDMRREGFDLLRLAPLRVALGGVPPDFRADHPGLPPETGVSLHWELVAPQEWPPAAPPRERSAGA
jgi:hypothetical protein